MYGRKKAYLAKLNGGSDLGSLLESHESDDHVFKVEEIVDGRFDFVADYHSDKYDGCIDDISQ